MKWRSKVSGSTYEGVDIFSYQTRTYSIGLRQVNVELNGSPAPTVELTYDQFIQLFEKVEE